MWSVYTVKAKGLSSCFNVVHTLDVSVRWCWMMLRSHTLTVLLLTSLSPLKVNKK